MKRYTLKNCTAISSRSLEVTYIDTHRMSWWESVIDAIPVVGTGYRTVNALGAHLQGDHERAQQEWGEAGMNLAGDALGLVTGGAGKVAATATRVGVKTAITVATKQGAKAITKASLKQAAKQGSRAATRAARKQLTKKAMKKYAKKYVKKKVKKAIKKGLKEAAEQAYEEDSEICILEEMHRFSGQWKGFYKQGGSRHDTECMLVIDLDGNIAGKGTDEVSDYTVSGSIENDGTFKFDKQYVGPTSHHLVVYTGSVEWKDKPVLQGEWNISNCQVDKFVIMANDIGLEASVISLCCYSAEEVIAMSHHQKREEIVDALSEIVEDMTRDELASLSDEELINVAEILTTEELYEENEEEDH